MGMAQNNFEVYETKFNILGEKMNELKKRVNTFDKIKEVLVELKILTTQQIEANAQRDKILREHGIALAKAVEALNELGKKQDNHEARLVDLNERLSEKFVVKKKHVFSRYVLSTTDPLNLSCGFTMYRDKKHVRWQSMMNLSFQDLLLYNYYKMIN